MSKRNLSELLGGDADAERPSTKQRRRSPSPPLPPPHRWHPHPRLPRPSPPPQGPPPAFQQPTQIISFSYTPARELEFTDSALRFLAAPPPRARLAHGYERWVRRPETRPRIDGLLRALSAARGKRHPALANGVGAVAWRGVLTRYVCSRCCVKMDGKADGEVERILTAPYEEREGWEMNVMRGCAKKTTSPRAIGLQTYFGYAFESYCTSATPSANPRAPGVNVPQAPGDPPGWGGDVDTNVQWCSVVRTKLGETRLVRSIGEVDCFRWKYTGKTDTFVELKTSLAIRGPQDEVRFEKKLLKFYMQSFLLGVPEIFVGFRTPSGEITTTQTFRTVEIPRLVRGKAHGWEPGMATPSSSATSPSPTIAFSPPLTTPPMHQDLPEADHRKAAVEKFRARAEISNVTRSLRARLSYASYKATHNLAHVPLRELEAQSQSQAQIFSRTMAAKRKASAALANTYSASGGNPATGGNNNYYNNPATQGSGSPGGSRRTGAGSMAPPAGPMRYYPGTVGAERPLPAQSLFTSILAPPPSQPARTILNVADPPVPPPSRPPPSPHAGVRPRTTKPASRSAGGASMQKSSSSSRHAAHDKASASKQRSTAKRAVDKGKARAHGHRRDIADDDVDADGDVDMKAAATLTSLLLNHRPSIGSASSPRSSLDADEDHTRGEAYGHYAQSSARHGGTPQPSAPSTSSQGAPELRRTSASVTPPPTQPSSQHSQHQQQTQPASQSQSTTPRPAPTDNEAADLMLFLATSPSPVRRERDREAYRALNGGAMGLGGRTSSKPVGRVLFPTAGELGGGLARGAADSFTSSVSSIGGMGSRGGTPVPAAPSPAPTAVPIQTPVAPAPVPAAQAQGSQLLPPAGVVASPVPRPATPTPTQKAVYGVPVSMLPAQAPTIQQQQVPSTAPAPQQPAPVPTQTQPAPQQVQDNFNFNDFLHASPSPGPGAAPAPPQQKAAASSLRADVGRKLFEEEQMRQAQAQAAGMGMGMQMQGNMGKAREGMQGREGLGAGIDLVQQS
ncbi:RAI1 domain-containing protein [Mycena venus]|uniref:NAD-capped RNA hydrolase RAI1 n=1 Tax=Mycena venus TaxID=2733690 RepID=A0A8H6X953_9AGAR|nr:RAI1 domain-containing protein [Mycena venus]